MPPAMARNKAVSSLHRLLRRALEQSGLAPAKLLVVAVSGGPDSLALLHALHHLREELSLELHGAHLDHGLRGEASRADAQFVADTLRGLGLPYTLEEADVASFRRRERLSLEEAAREVRYAFLARVAAEQKADAVALGHTADDQVETVLMNMIRGAGLTGLRGMTPATRRAFDGEEVTLIRPLLKASRRETEAYCYALDLVPRRDDSNRSPEATRNRIRMELLPLLEGYNPSVRDALLRLSAAAARDMDYLEGEVDVVWDQVAGLDASRDEAGVTLSRAAFSLLAPAIQSHLLRRAVLVAKGNLEAVGQNHIDGMAHLMSGAAGRSLDLPGGIRFTVGYTDATLAHPEPGPHDPPPLGGEHELSTPGETMLPGWRVLSSLTARLTEGGTGANSACHLAYLDWDALGGHVWVRPRTPGDRFQPLGMAQAKKLQDFMVDSKIPRELRDRIPLVVSPRGIAWVVGWRIAEWAKPREGEARLLELRFSRR